MKMQFKLMLAASLLMLSTNAIAAGGWYISGNISNNSLNDINTTSSNTVGGSARTVDLTSDSGTGLGIAIGKSLYETSSGALSFELGYQTSDHELEGVNFNSRQFSSDAGTAVGETSVDTWSLSALYHFGSGSFKPYLGLGIGSTSVDVTARYGASVQSPGSPPFINDSDSSFSLLYRAGLDYAFSSNLSVFAEYRLTDVDEISVNRTGGGPGGPATTTQLGDFDTDQFSIGFKYNF